MKKRLLKLVALGLVLGSTLTACWLLLPESGFERTDNAYVHGEITQISAEVGGVLTELSVTDNQQVKAGQLLARIDDRDYRARLDQAVAGLELSRASLDNLAARIKVQRLKIRESASRVEAAQAKAQLQKSELKRYKALVSTGAVSRNSYDQQVSKQRQASAGLAAAERQLDASRQQLEGLNTERDRLEALQKQAEAGVELAKLALEHTEIRAPVAGIVADRKVQAGRLVKAGMPLLSLVPIEQIWVEANFKESQVTHMRAGQSVEVHLDRLPEHPLQGHIESLAPATGSQFGLIPASNATGNFVKIVQRVPVRIALQLPDELRGQVVPGLSAEVAVAVAER
ncbi:HlyD family secretion protein [Microbulbifer hainanensis]|uniref:HlyD family secretion protein n=1 Tax=Microbulbifer hainanensis TaxID=2735675 RepID=UPI001865C88C|nr:HlyD family secretion protein [Microbulbifer hainanensis]